MTTKCKSKNQKIKKSKKSRNQKIKKYATILRKVEILKYNNVRATKTNNFLYEYVLLEDILILQYYRDFLRVFFFFFFALASSSSSLSLFPSSFPFSFPSSFSSSFPSSSSSKSERYTSS